MPTIAQIRSRFIAHPYTVIVEAFAIIVCTATLGVIALACFLSSALMIGESLQRLLGL